MNKYYLILCIGLLSVSVTWGLVQETNRAVMAAGQARAAVPSPAAEEGARDVLGRELTDAIRLINQYALPYDKQRAGRAAIHALLEQVDPLGRILPDDKTGMPTHRERFSSVGILFTVTNGLPQVTRVIEDTDAERVGLKAGDRIEMIDGESMKDRPHMAIAALLRGPLDETTSLEIIRGDQRLQMDVKRDQAAWPDIEVVDALPGDMLYIRVNNLDAGTGRKLTDLLEEHHANGIFGAVLDLRGAGGDNLDSAAQFASVFADPGAMLFVLRDAQDQDIETHNAPPEQTYPRIPLMVLIDRETCGASEVLAAVLKGSVQGVMLLGEATMGDFVIREPLTMQSGMRLYVTTRRLVVGDGQSYTGREGVLPNIPIKPPSMAASQADEEWFDEKESPEAKTLRLYTRHDPVLRRAVDLLLGLKALNIWGAAEETRNDE